MDGRGSSSLSAGRLPPRGAVQRYLAALFGWVAGGLAGPVAVAVVVVVAVEARCGETSDCSWGFELLVVLPVLLLCFLAVGPWLVGWSFTRWIHPLLRGRARRAALRSSALSVVLLFLASGTGWSAFRSTVLAVAFGVPGVVSWSTRAGPAIGSH